MVTSEHSYAIHFHVRCLICCIVFISFLNFSHILYCYLIWNFFTKVSVSVCHTKWANFPFFRDVYSQRFLLLSFITNLYSILVWHSADFLHHSFVCYIVCIWFWDLCFEHNSASFDRCKYCWLIVNLCLDGAENFFFSFSTFSKALNWWPFLRISDLW